jgi:large conductance mechanosensitive channel
MGTFPKSATFFFLRETLEKGRISANNVRNDFIWEGRMGFIKEFKEFAVKGNVVELAVAVIVGGAFGKIVTSLVNDVIMPPIGLLLKNVNFTEFFWALDGKTYESLEQAQKAGAPTLNYGMFINNVLNFLIISFVVFLAVRAMNRMRRKKAEDPKPVTTRECPECLSEIPLRAKRCKFCTAELKPADEVQGL